MQMHIILLLCRWETVATTDALQPYCPWEKDGIVCTVWATSEKGVWAQIFVQVCNMWRESLSAEERKRSQQLLG